MQNFIRLIIVATIIIAGCFFSSCDNKDRRDVLLFGFEDDLELDRLHWKCHTLFSISDKYTSQGEKSLKVELYPSAYPGVVFKKYEKNWLGYSGLSFDVFNPSKEKINLIVRIDDALDTTSYADRYNHRFVLLPGENHIIIPFATLITSGTQRKLNLKKICRFMVFVVKPEERVELYIDTIQLKITGEL